MYEKPLTNGVLGHFHQKGQETRRSDLVPRPSETRQLRGCTADWEVLLRAKHCSFVMLEEERQTIWACRKTKRKCSGKQRLC